MVFKAVIGAVALPLLLRTAGAVQLDVNSPDSIKSAAKTVASAIGATYSQRPGDNFVGVFGDGTKPYYWWESGAVWAALVSYGQLTGDTSFNSVASKALWGQVGDYDAFMPPNQTKTLGNDDQATWGQAAMTAAEVGLPKAEGMKPEWIDIARNVFSTQTLRWDEKTCAGGLRWQIFSFNKGYDYKNSYSNALFFLLSARLAQFEKNGNKTYADWADKSFKWMQDVGLINDKYQVFDGTDASMNCSQVNHIQWTYNHGLIVEGAAVMFNITNGDQKWKDRLNGIQNNTQVFLAKGSSNVLTEVACENTEKCDTDMRAFKGLAIRSFARASIAAPFLTDAYSPILKASAQAAAKGCDGKDADLACRFRWDQDEGPTTKVSNGGLGEAFDALEAMQGLLWSQQKSVSSPNTSNGNGGGSPSANGTASGTGAPKATGSSAAGHVGVTSSGLMGVAVVGLAMLGL